MSTRNGLLATLLVDGMAAGVWKIVRERGTASLVIDAFARISRKDKLAVCEEGMRLFAFTDPVEAKHDVRFLAPA